MKRTSLRQRTALAFVTLLLALSFAATAYAHGVVITYILKANGEVELLAEFDTGEPLAEAQVTVYSPDDPLTPWLTGTADAAGHYTFVIDPEMPGIWDIQFRKAGHGDIVHLQLETGMIDPALLDQPPGELLPDPSAAITADAAENEAGAAAAEKSETTENTVHTAHETTANKAEMTGAETETEAAEATAAETAAAEAKETLSDESEEAKAETAPVTAAEPTVEPESAVQVGVAPDVDTAEKATVAEAAPEIGAVAVLSSGGNTAATGGFTTFQILLMSASVIWGFVGTALYFSGKKTHDHGHVHE